MMRILYSFCMLLLTCFCVRAIQGQSVANAAKTSANISIDPHKGTGSMIPLWAWFGYDEPNYTYMKEGKKTGSLQQPSPARVKQLEKAGQLQQTRRFNATVKNNLLQFSMQLPRQGIAFYKINW